MNTVVIVGQEPEFAERLCALLPSSQLTVVRAATLAEGVSTARSHGISVLVTDPSVHVEEVLVVARSLQQGEDGIAVVAVVPTADTDLMRRALRAGLHDLLSAGEQTWTEVASAIVDAAVEVESRHGLSEGGSQNAASHRGRVISVMGTKGGVGKSVIATNLVASLAEKGRDVVLVDLDLASGDVGIMLTLEPTLTIRDAVAAADRLDADMLAGYLVRHKSGARVLLAPARPEEADIVTAARVARVLDLLRDTAEFVVVDTPSAWDETTLAAADASDRILAVTGMDVPSVKNTALMMSRLAQLGRSNGQVGVILNRADSKVLIEEKDVEKALGHGISSRIPSDRAVPRSVNKGVPIVLESPRLAVSKAVIELAAGLITNGV